VAGTFFCELIFADKFDTGREPSAQLPWQRNNMRHSTLVRDVKHITD